VGSHPLFHKNLQLRVLGCDPQLDKSDEVARFLLTHARKPRMEVLIKGYHMEWENNFDGKAFSNQVVDWSCRMDISDACCDSWAFVSAAAGLSFHDAISAFCRSNAPVKALAMDCAVEWNWEELRAALDRIVMSTGWNGMYSITFPRFPQTAVGVMSCNRSSRLLSSAAFRGLCAVSFLWIVAWPIHSCLKHGGETATLTAHYSMVCSWAEFFGKNCRQIRRAICKRERSAVLRLNPKTLIGGGAARAEGGWGDEVALPRILSAAAAPVAAKAAAEAAAAAAAAASPRNRRDSRSGSGSYEVLPPIGLHDRVQQQQQQQQPLASHSFTKSRVPH